MTTHGEKLKAAMARQVRAERTALGLTQSELGDRIGKDGQTVARYEKGLRDISVSQLADLASVFGISARDLLERADERIKQIDGSDA